jgi:YggT family protein
LEVNLFVFANLIEALATIVSYLLQIYMWVIIIRALISWVNPDPYNPIVRFLYQVTEPVLYPIRRRLPFMGGMDLSPIIVLLAILFLQVFLVKTLNELAFRLKMGGGL